VALVGEESVSGGPRRRARQLSSAPNWSATLPACLWGNWEGPHVHDVAMEIILRALYQANVSVLGLEFANPRRQHAVAALRKCKLPDRMVLIPGVIDPKSNFVEHPEVVAQRIEAVVAAMSDRERVIAGVDLRLRPCCQVNLSRSEKPKRHARSHGGHRIPPSARRLGSKDPQR
jgi:hypothetical protein